MSRGKRALAFCSGLGAAAILAIGLWIHFNSYSGTVDGLKYSAQGLELYLDGNAPYQSMTLWIPRVAFDSIEARYHQMPPVGATVSAKGPFRWDGSRTEIVIHSADQLSWDSATATTTPAAPDLTHGYTDKDGTEYFVSDADFNRLQPLKVQLDAEAAEIDHMKADDVASARMMEGYKKSASEGTLSPEAYNDRVDAFNSFENSIAAKVEDYNRKVASFNAELHRVGAQKK